MTLKWLQWAQTMEMKQNQTFFHGIYSNLTWIFIGHKILKYFNDFQNQHFSVLWLQWAQTVKMKQNQTFFHGTYSNLTWFFIGHKILKYFNDFDNWYLSISLQKWAQLSKSENFCPYLQRGTLIKWLLKFIFW